jgi:hypothetical protein
MTVRVYCLQPGGRDYQSGSFSTAACPETLTAINTNAINTSAVTQNRPMKVT